MGLDMYLYADKYVGGHSVLKDDNYDELARLVGAPLDPDSPHMTISACVGYWRKANAIHAWFVDNVQGGIDECQKSYVEPEQLKVLYKACEEDLDNVRNGRAVQHLAPRSGFFFGSTEINESFKQDLEQTLAIIRRVFAFLERERKQTGSPYNSWDLYYQSSW